MITLSLDRTSGLDESQYLKMTFSQINVFDKNILLIIDEIYWPKRIETWRGEIFGLTEICETARTALRFMIKLLSGDYRVMIGIYPVKNLKAEIKKCFDKVMYALHKTGFNFVALFVDDAAAKQEIIKDFLRDGDMKEFIDNIINGERFFTF